MAKANPSFTHSEGKSFEIQASPCEMKNNLGFSFLNTANAFGSSQNYVTSQEEQRSFTRDHHQNFILENFCNFGEEIDEQSFVEDTQSDFHLFVNSNEKTVQKDGGIMKPYSTFKSRMPEQMTQLGAKIKF